MGYLFDHTALFDANPLYLIPVFFMLGVLVFCIIRVRKMKRELNALETELSGKLAKFAIGDTEPIMENSLEKIQQHK